MPRDGGLGQALAQVKPTDRGPEFGIHGDIPRGGIGGDHILLFCGPFLPKKIVHDAVLTTQFRRDSVNS